MFVLTNKRIALLGMVLGVMNLLVTPLNAQEFGFGAIDEDLTSAQSPSPFRFTGELTFSARALVNFDSPFKSVIEGLSRGQVGVEHSTEGSLVRMSLQLSPEILTSNPAQVLKEASVTVFLGDLDLKAGLFSLTWGKADSLRLLDVVNAQDYGDFVNQDLEVRKIPQAMIYSSWRYSGNGKLEGVYVPFFEADRVPISGTWAPGAYTGLLGQAYTGFYNGIYQATYGTIFGGLVSAAQTQAYTDTYAATYAFRLAQGDTTTVAASAAATAAATAHDAFLVNSTEMAKLDASATLLATSQAAQQATTLRDTMIVAPNTQSLEWTQGGLRLTDTLGGLDWGLQYYRGFLRLPSFNADPNQLVTTQKIALDYNPYHLAGVDLATVLFNWNLRFEGAFVLTSDWEGTDPLVYNPKASWSAGLDNNLFGIDLNLQGQGDYRLFHDKITNPYDVEANTTLATHTLAIRLAKGFINDKIVFEAAGAYRWEEQDYAILPTLTFKLPGETELRILGRWFGGEINTQFGQYNKNSHVEIQFRTFF